MDPVRRDAVLSTSLRIKQQFSIRISVPRLSPFAYAGGDSVCSGRDRAGTGDMRGRPSIYIFSGIIGAHISAKMSRYARLILDIRLQWHHQGAYLRNESEGEKQASKSPAAARCVTDREHDIFVSF